MLHINTEAIKPVSQNFRDLEPDHAFTFSDGISSLGSEGILLVAFEMKIEAEATSEQVAELKELDLNAQEEAKEQEGFIMYFPDEISSDGKALSFCLWDSISHARAASQQPSHREAVAYARNSEHNVYEDYQVRRYIGKFVIDASGVKTLEFEELTLKVGEQEATSE